MIAETSAALGGIKAAFDIAKGVSSLKTETDRNEAVISIQRILLEAQESALSDKELIGQLREEVRNQRSAAEKTDAWKAEKRRYRLTRSPLGAFTYDLREECADGEVSHRLCATCFDDGHKSVLHTVANHSGGERVACQKCGKELQLAKFNYSAAPQIVTAC